MILRPYLCGSGHSAVELGRVVVERRLERLHIIAKVLHNAARSSSKAACPAMLRSVTYLVDVSADALEGREEDAAHAEPPHRPRARPREQPPHPVLLQHVPQRNLHAGEHTRC
jgi:hypothetical protein